MLVTYCFSITYGIGLPVAAGLVGRKSTCLRVELLAQKWSWPLRVGELIYLMRAVDTFPSAECLRRAQDDTAGEVVPAVSC